MMRSLLVRLAGINTLSYAVSAATFLLFTVIFTRQFGPERYAEFSILLNSFTAILLLSNYQGYLVGYSVAESRPAFRRFMPYGIGYSLAAAVAGTALFAAVTGASGPVLALLGGAFACMFAVALPATVVLATAHNWRLTAYRAGYQVLLVALFYGAFVVADGIGTAFAVAALGAGVLFLVLVARQASALLRPAPSDHPEASPGLILTAAGANGALMLTQLVDKIAVSHLGVGPDQACVGIYFVYYDVIFRFSTVFVIMVYPLTYTFLSRLREGRPIGRVIAGMVGGIGAVAAAAAIAGYLVVPPLYGLSLACAPALPLLLSLLLGAAGASYVVTAFCNADKQGSVLAWQNLLILAAMAAGILTMHGLGLLTVTGMAAVLALAKAGTLVTLAWIVLRVIRRDRAAVTATATASPR